MHAVTPFMHDVTQFVRAHLGGERDLGGLEGVVWGEVDVDEEDAARVRAVRRAHDGGLPAEEIVAGWPRAARGGGILLEILWEGEWR